jgi:hypothetical protein
MVFLAVVTLELCAYIYINVMGYVVEWIQACVCTHVPATPFPVEPVVVFFFFFAVVVVALFACFLCSLFLHHASATLSRSVSPRKVAKRKLSWLSARLPLPSNSTPLPLLLLSLGLPVRRSKCCVSETAPSSSLLLSPSSLRAVRPYFWTEPALLLLM